MHNNRMETRSLTCVACPIGCAVTVGLEDGEAVRVSGNSCKRGEAYARAECTNPTRMLTSTVRVTGGEAALTPVKSAAPLPKRLLLACMAVINRAQLDAPIAAGDVVIKNILDTGVDIIATNRNRKEP